MTDTSPAFEPKVPVSVVHNLADNSAFFRGERDQSVSDRSVNCAWLGRHPWPLLRWRPRPIRWSR